MHDGPTFVRCKKWLISANLGQGLFKKVGSFLIFVPILRAGFFDKMLALSNKNPSLSLFLAFLTLVFSKFCPNIIGKVAF